MKSIYLVLGIVIMIGASVLSNSDTRYQTLVILFIGIFLLYSSKSDLEKVVYLNTLKLYFPFLLGLVALSYLILNFYVKYLNIK